MLGKNLTKLLNDQVNFELYSSYIYFSMSSYFKSQNLNGMAQWMYVQTLEEMTHAEKIYNYIHERDGDVELKAIDKPEHKWKSPLMAFETAYKHEQIVTSRINKLVDAALKEKDHAANLFLQWFVNEQVEEEANALDIINQLKLIQGSPQGLFMIDRELGQRVFTPPADTAQ